LLQSRLLLLSVTNVRYYLFEHLDTRSTIHPYFQINNMYSIIKYINIICLICPQVKSGTCRWWLVPQTTGGTRRPGVATSRLRDGAHDHGSANAGAIWPRTWTRVCRRVHIGVLEARDGGMETVQEMGRKTGENRTIEISNCYHYSDNC